MSSLSIFGVTGSIGASALKVWQMGGFEIDTITAGENLELLVKIARETNARHVVIGNESKLEDLRSALPNVEVGAGAQAIAEAAKREVEICLNAIVGAAGLPVSFGAAGHAARLALANKESLVCAGQALRSLCDVGDTEILPVDSEHSAIFQCLEGQDKTALSRIILTASGGPFRNATIEEMKDAKLSDALKHPSWNMGARITIDSASMFNKALEMIEARELFDVAPEQIDVIVHPQSIVHSLVEFDDAGLLAQVGVPDMRHAIAYALHYPSRKENGVEKLDLAKIAQLDFEAPDPVRFKALNLAREAMAQRGGAGAALNGAKEVCLDAFIAKKIGFMDMADIVEQVLEDGDWKGELNSLTSTLEVDKRARQLASSIINKNL